MLFRDVVVSGEWRSRPAQYRSDQIIVGVLDSVPWREIPATIAGAVAGFTGAEIISHRAGRRWAIVKVPQGVEAGRMAEALSQQAGLLFAEPDFLMTARSLTPSDAKIAEQEWVDKIRLKEAWGLIKETWGLPIGSADVLLAVLDSGIQTYGGLGIDHPDFAPLRFVLTHRDDTMAYVSHDFWKGAAIPSDEHGHGTEVAGILAATADNGIGIAGVNWESKVFMARVLDEEALTCVGAVEEALDLLAEYAARIGNTRVVVNLSLASTYTAEIASLDSMIAKLDSDVFLLCCAVGYWLEDADTNTWRAMYPARYATTRDCVISVGESDIDDEVRTPYSTMNLADPKEVTLVAPGEDAYTTLRHNPSNAASGSAVPYGTADGSSMACPMVAGVASLMWSVSPWLTPTQIRACLVGSATSLPPMNGVVYLRLDAEAALLAVRADIVLSTPGIAFVDIPSGAEERRDLEMTATGCAPLTFRVSLVLGSDAAFTLEGDTMSYIPGSSGVVTGVRVKYTAGATGTTAAGTVKITLDRSTLEWEVILTANAVDAVGVAIALVADTSGSMALPSGIMLKDRIDVLKDSLKTAVNTILPGCACALVRFDSDAHLDTGLTAIAASDTADAGRVALRDKVDLFVPGGGTSIGDGVRLGNDTAVADVTRPPAVLVLTDGHENQPELIADVMDEVTAPVYAIGMGTAAIIQPAALDQLASATGGYLLLTDTLDDENQNKVTKYVLQMLADIIGDSVIVDPVGYVSPERAIEIPFWLTGQEQRCDVIVMLPAKNAITVKLITPAGRRIKASGKGVDFGAGDHVSFCRLDVGGVLSKERIGRWRAHLSVSDKQLVAFKESQDDNARARTDAHGIPYDLMVLGRSSLTMRARSYANGFEPGSRVRLRAVLRDGGQPPTRPSMVSARIQAPDRSRLDVRLKTTGAGIYEHAFDAEMPGVYTSTIRAAGFNARSEAYTREQTVTSHIWTGSRATPVVARAPVRVR